jgi:mitochondrial fission protein ELM1
VENSHKDPVLTQVLALLNGPVYNQVFQSSSVLMQNIRDAETLRDKIDVMFLSTLSRRASEEEQQLMLQELGHYGRVKNGGHSKVSSDQEFLPGYRNILSALLNTRQYMFLQ